MTNPKAESVELAGPDAGARVIIAANPYSGHGENRAYVHRLAEALAEHGLAAEVCWDRHGLERLRTREPGGADGNQAGPLRCVVAAGGDGTIAGVVAGRFDAPLGVLPLGNENLFAGHFGFQLEPERLAHAIARGKTRAVDLGSVRSDAADAQPQGDQADDPESTGHTDARPFTLMVSAGIDADVVHRLARWRNADGELRRVSHLSYVQRVLGAMTEYDYPEITLETDRGEQARGAMALVFNLPRYGMGLPFTPEARGDDALLDWVVFERKGLIHLADYAWSVLRTRHLGRPDVPNGRAASIRLTSRTPVPLQADGDAIGFTPQRIEVRPGALRVVEPVDSAVSGRD